MVRNLYIYFISPQWTWTEGSLMFTDTNVESLEPIQPDIIGASLAVPSLQMEPTLEKVLYFFTILLFTLSPDNLPFSNTSLICRHLVHQLWAIFQLQRIHRRGWSQFISYYFPRGSVRWNQKLAKRYAASARKRHSQFGLGCWSCKQDSLGHQEQSTLEPCWSFGSFV